MTVQACDVAATVSVGWAAVVANRGVVLWIGLWVGSDSGAQWLPIAATLGSRPTSPTVIHMVNRTGVEPLAA